MSSFKLISDFSPQGDQPGAIETLSKNILSDKKNHVLLGVTGSGKTFTMAHVVAAVQKPTLVIAPNKTLAAQLFFEFRALFSENAVEYFVSYYDYYQPEAYIPSSDTYIQKDSNINEMIDKLRHSATRSVLSRSDVLVVASVSCIFGLGEPEDYHSMRIDIENDIEFGREKVLSDLVAMHYERNDFDFHRGVFRVRGDRIEIFPAYEEDKAVRVEFFGDEIEGISEIDPLTGKALGRLKRITIFPASHYVTQKGTLQRATASIQTELKERIDYLQKERKLIEAQRIEERTNFDLEMMQELGYCTGIENYSRHFTGRAPGEPPPTLLDYFPDDYLIFVDESHISIPQLNAMYKGDKSRKETLVEFGFRLPSALDNRPLKFEEFESKTPQIIYVSATPAEYELKKGRGALAELIVRPTGLIDPKCDVRSAENQVDNLYEEILGRMERGERVLVTTLTKRMAEDLTDYYSELGIRVRYLHSDIRTLERMDIIRDLRKGTFDVLIGINLLREGLDIPEVSLVAILDADKEGFLRSTRSLIQTCGRASRNVGGQVIMYGDHITRSMKTALAEMDRRRKIQTIYNKKNNITPTSIKKNLPSIFESVYESDYVTAGSVSEPLAEYASTDNLDDILMTLEKEMGEAAKKLEFERAAELRDRISEIKKSMIFEFR
ncbi:MAG: excinuclease ABC subunit UvrB [Desulfobacterales bacterium]|jgi:excinuclease ABC subunit B|nr:excinuclease ABC subunit UvrB [Desulfobacterales bacterium]MDP6806609.1 excinuclease ABC subunit UvrB [Desulfobacterales bacterium]|tara:strand:- start:55298 stop:57295 length:1998 start_codon:yes stop_codon:yes gene_type:complete